MFIIEGLAIGLLTLFIIGPVLFILINATIENGIRSGIFVAFGIFLGDLIYAILVARGLNSFLDKDFFNEYLSLIGFFILFGFGLTYVLKKKSNTDYSKKITNRTHFQNFFKGFGVNFFNPFVLSFWALFYKYGMTKYENNVLVFLISIVVGILLIDLVKVFLAKKLTILIHSNKLYLFYKISGVLMLLFSFRILYTYIIA